MPPAPPFPLCQFSRPRDVAVQRVRIQWSEKCIQIVHSAVLPGVSEVLAPGRPAAPFLMAVHKKVEVVQVWIVRRAIGYISPGGPSFTTSKEEAIGASI